MHAHAAVAPNIRLATLAGTAKVPPYGLEGVRKPAQPGHPANHPPPERTRAGFRHRSLVKLRSYDCIAQWNRQRLGRHTYCLIARYNNDLGVQQALVNDDTEDPPGYHLRGAASCQIAT